MPGETSLTLVLNTRARKPRLRPPSAAHLRDLLGPRARIHVTRSLEDLDRLMSGWSTRDRSHETLCFYGGDGSIARGLTSLIRHKGSDARLPPVLAVRAGTINMLCSLLGFRESVDRTLASWERGELTRLMLIPTIRVQVEEEPPQYGFVLAWGVGYRVLREYYSRASVPTVGDGVAVAARAFARACLPGAEKLRLFRADGIALRIDGKTSEIGPVRSLLVGTIGRVSLGIRPFPPGPAGPGTFHVSASGISLARTAWHAPTLLLGRGDQRELEARLPGRLVARSAASELSCELSEGFTMDGEMFALPSRSRVRISPGPAVRFWVR